MDLIKLSRRTPRTAGIAVVAMSLLWPRAAVAADGDAFRPASFQSLSLAKAGTFGADFYVDDRDRDPWGIDVFDTGLRFRYQAGDNTEVFGYAIVDRVVAGPEAPAIPVSPRDLLFLGPSRIIPSVFEGEHPYFDKRGDERFDSFIPGVATIGVTRVLRREGLAFGLSAGLNIPMAGNLNALRSGANSGRPDALFALLGSHEAFGGRIHGRVGFTIAGKGSWTDRSYSVSGNTVTLTETHPPIGNRLDAGLAWLRPFAKTWAISLEARTKKEFVGEERLDAASPLDVMMAIHKDFGHLTFSASLLDHLGALPSGAVRNNPLAGAIDLSNVAPQDRNAFLARVGLGAAAGQVRDGAHIVAIGVTASTLPAGAVVIAPTYNVRSEHNLGYIFTLTWRP
jgi:hypothetical protein